MDTPLSPQALLGHGLVVEVIDAAGERVVHARRATRLWIGCTTRAVGDAGVVVRDA